MAEKIKTNQNLAWLVVSLSTPLILQNLSTTLLGVVDTWFVSNLGTEAIGAVGLASVLYFAVLLLFRSTATASVAFVGRAYGEGDLHRVGDVVWRGLNMIVLLSLPVFLFPSLFALLFGWLAPTDDGGLVRELGTGYLRIRSFEIPLIMFSAIVWAFLVGHGDSRTPMLIAWGTVLLNILLDWLLVLGNLGFPQLGVDGAAIASVLANLGNAIASAIILWSASNRKIFDTGRPRLAAWAEIRQLIVIGVPAGMGDFIEIASFTLFFGFIGRLGTEILAANQIALQYLSMTFTIALAVNMGLSGIVARFLGEDDPDSAVRATWLAVGMGTSLVVAIGLSYLIAPELLIGFFTEDQAVIEAGVTVLVLIAFYQVFDGAGIILAGALNGAGDTRFTMLARALLAWGLFIPISWVVIFRWDGGLWGGWVVALAYLGLLAFIYLARFLQGGWKEIELE